MEAGRRPSVWAAMLGSMLQKAREIVGLSYDQAAARLGCPADWLVRVETGFAVAAPDEVARILTEYGVREAKIADEVIDMARRVAAPPAWLAAHTSRLTADARDVLVVEAEATLARVHGFRLIPSLVQAEGYFRQVAPKLFPGCDIDQEWDLLSHRQAHQPAGVTRLLEVIIDENTLDLRLEQRGAMAGQVRHLLALAGRPHATVRVIPRDAPFYESRGHQFDILAYAGTADRIGVSYTILGYQLESATTCTTCGHGSRPPQQPARNTAGTSSNATSLPDPGHTIPGTRRSSPATGSRSHAARRPRGPARHTAALQETPNSPECPGAPSLRHRTG